MVARLEIYIWPMTQGISTAVVAADNQRETLGTAAKPRIFLETGTRRVFADTLTPRPVFATIRVFKKP